MTLRLLLSLGRKRALASIFDADCLLFPELPYIRTVSWSYRVAPRASHRFWQQQSQFQATRLTSLRAQMHKMQRTCPRRLLSLETAPASEEPCCWRALAQNGVISALLCTLLSCRCCSCPIKHKHLGRPSAMWQTVYGMQGFTLPSPHLCAEGAAHAAVRSLLCAC